MPRLALLLVAIALTLPANAQEPPQGLALVGATVIDPGEGRALPGATVRVAAGKIEAVVADGGGVPDGYRVLDLRGRFLLPGLIDAHVHIRDLAAARRALLSGVTTARSMGVFHFVDVGLRELQARGLAEAPEIVAAGYHVRPQAAEALVLDHPELGDLLASGVKGEEALRRLVRVMAAHGVGFIKVVATDRAGLPETDPRRPLYSEAELSALVAEATRAGIPVAAHAHGDEGGRAAVAAGVRSIEHGTYLSPETLALMVQRGTYLVPTLAVVADLTQPGGDYDDPVLQVRGRHMLPRVRAMTAEAHRRGVKIVAATDTTYGPESVLRLGHELEELVGAGLSPLAALRAATTVAAELLGVADHTGRIAPGLDADLLVLESNPLADVGAVQDPLLVVSDGRVVLDRLNW